MFVDQWGAGRDARRCRVAALATCRTCVVRRECGLAALADVDAGMSLYGVLCGVEFTDVTPSRQQKDVDRLRAVVAKLDEAAAAGSSLRPIQGRTRERTPDLTPCRKEEQDSGILVTAGTVA
jgi:hypothetical protein